MIIKIDENTGELSFQFIKDAKVQNQSWKFAGDIRGYGSSQQ